MGAPDTVGVTPVLVLRSTSYHVTVTVGGVAVVGGDGTRNEIPRGGSASHKWSGRLPTPYTYATGSALLHSLLLPLLLP